MADLKESFHGSIIIKRAKRRLIGAITILIMLFTLSVFFVENTGQSESNKEIKVSFLEMAPASFNRKENIEKVEFIRLSPERFQKKTNTVNKLENNTEIFTVQIGIFSDTNKTKKLSNQINNIGLETQIKKIRLSGQEQIQLTTQFFNSETEARKALKKLKNANFPGLIKRQ